MTGSEDTPNPQEAVELRGIASRIRSDAWELAERWSVVAAEHAPASTPRGGEQLTRFGEIPAFLAALAHHLERIADGDPHVIASDSDERRDGSGLPLPASDDGLRAAAIDHAKARASAGYDQRDMLAEFVALRRVLWEHFAASGAAERPTFEGERIVNLLLDAVVVEAADQFFAELTDALVRRAERDALTDLYNRQAFHDKLGREMARARRFGRELTVVTIDLDAFKQVNDTLGHLAGDAVLKRLSTLLVTHTREQDIVGRLGGDEFAVALVEAGMATARDLIRRLRIHLVPARRQFGLPREFGISFGAACFPADGDTVEKLLFHADGGLYKQKGPGRGLKMEAAGHAPQLGKVRVLVADDDAGLRALCRAALEVEGFEVEEAANGEQAVAMASTRMPDVLLLDLAMPHLDGWQVLDRLASTPETSGVPVVMMTGSASQENLDRADRAGVLDFIGKPFEPSDLVSTVNHVLELTERAVVGDLG
ncbi:MAG: sensor histidine kinase response receiver diguanylate cyclase [Thermoleophilia bacterium]|nr:sensor histidine kinase response receiver diguanylate cyclase [Thermoleophilia bacterium]